MIEENEYDFGLTTEIDVTTDVLYQFVSVSLNPDALVGEDQWVCYRVVVANGSKRFAKHPTFLSRVTNFNRPSRLLKASLAATYTY